MCPELIKCFSILDLWGSLSQTIRSCQSLYNHLPNAVLWVHWASETYVNHTELQRGTVFGGCENTVAKSFFVTTLVSSSHHSFSFEIGGEMCRRLERQSKGFTLSRQKILLKCISVFGKNGCRRLFCQTEDKQLGRESLLCYFQYQFSFFNGNFIKNYNSKGNN